jgi:hypothetical protein
MSDIVPCDSHTLAQDAVHHMGISDLTTVQLSFADFKLMHDLHGKVHFCCVHVVSVNNEIHWKFQGLLF